MESKEWIILPGSEDSFTHFLNVVSKYLSDNQGYYDKPLLIIGDSGIGKSMYLEAAKQEYIKNGFDKSKIIRLNCASFSQNLAESEIFGHTKGAFTGAVSDKAGIIETIKNGLLILDEIGELPFEVQAKLLIFIEEGEYRRVGSNEIRRSTLKIVGTTNKTRENFRSDFWFRFFPVFIPPIHERRSDVLYYIALKYPDLFKRLTPRHLLSLLAHNWPGNFRELERVVSIMMYEDITSDSALHIYDGRVGDVLVKPLFFPVDPRQTSLANFYLNDFFNKIASAKFDIEKLNRIISRFGLKIPQFETIRTTSDRYLRLKEKTPQKEEEIPEENYIPDDPPLEVVTDPKLLRMFRMMIFPQEMNSTFHQYFHEFCCAGKMSYEMSLFGISLKKTVFDRLDNFYLVDLNLKIEKIWSTFSCVCKLFFRDVLSDMNVFDSVNVRLDKPNYSDKLQKIILKRLEKSGLIKDAFEFLVGRKLNINRRIEFGNVGYWDNFVRQVVDDNKEAFRFLLASNDVDKDIDFEVTQEELTRSYYRYLLDKYPTLDLASRHAGLKLSTFRSALRKRGMLPSQEKNATA